MENKYITAKTVYVHADNCELSSQIDILLKESKKSVSWKLRELFEKVWRLLLHHHGVNADQSARFDQLAKKTQKEIIQMHPCIFYFCCKFNNNKEYLQCLEILLDLKLKECNSNTIFAQYHNETSLFFAAKTANLSMMKLLAKYSFDFPSLINYKTKDHLFGNTVFLTLCCKKNDSNAIQCLEYLFDVSKHMNFTIDTTAQNTNG